MRKTDIVKKFRYRVPDRIYCYQQQWYFQAREGDMGPFESRVTAEVALARHITETEGRNAPWPPPDNIVKRQPNAGPVSDSGASATTTGEGHP